uniref:Uncharacterized protein n=1 Tax=Megaselia scalaris TaxID=36166 RepID=T1GWY5_MEGSC
MSLEVLLSLSPMDFVMESIAAKSVLRLQGEVKEIFQCSLMDQRHWKEYQADAIVDPKSLDVETEIRRKQGWALSVLRNLRDYDMKLVFTSKHGLRPMGPQ